MPFVVEAREIGCVCESCILSDGSTCPNQAYCPLWKAVNLRTGKPLLDDNFKNLHWPIPDQNDRTDRNDNTCNSFRDSCDSFVRSLDEPSDWDPILDILQKYTNYTDLETYVESLPNNMLKRLNCGINKFNKKIHSIDDTARQCLPHDAPPNFVPVFTVGDGNCFPRSLSCLAFGNDSRHVELRARIVVEGIYNRTRYLDKEYLSLGSKSLRLPGSYTEQYALFSGQHAHSDLSDIIESVYENEMLEMCKNGSHMGMWQIWAATNVLGRPIMSIFPNRGSTVFRSDFNRLCLPHELSARKKQPYHIMWTPVVNQGRIEHFVPLLKK